MANDYRVLAEHPTHFEIHDGRGAFRIAKQGLSPELVAKIQRFAKGGEVRGGAGERVPPLQLMNLREGEAEVPINDQRGDRVEYTPPKRKGEVDVKVGDVKLLSRKPDRERWREVEAEEGFAAGGQVPMPIGPPGMAPGLPAAAQDEEAIAALGQSLRPPDESQFGPNLARTLSDFGSDIATSPYALRLSPVVRTVGGVPTVMPGDSPEQQTMTAAARRKQGYGESPPAPTAASSHYRPPPPASPPPSGGGVPVADEFERRGNALAEAEAAAEGRKADIAERSANASAEAMKSGQRAAAEVIAHRASMQAEFEKTYQSEFQRYRGLVDAYSRSEIDPSRFWASRSTGDKVLAAVGLALGAVGAGADGVNHAVGILDNAVNRDIEAQKSAADLRKGAVAEQGSLLGIMRSHFGESMQAQAATEAAMWQAVEMRVQEVAARYQGPAAQAQAQLLSAQIRQKWLDANEKAKVERVAKSAEAAKNWAEAKAKGGANAGKEAALAAIDRFSKAWEAGGGRGGSISRHVPGDWAAKDVDAQRTAVASEAASAIGKGGRASFILSGLPVVGEDQTLGRKKIAAMRAAIESGQFGGNDEEQLGAQGAE